MEGGGVFELGNPEGRGGSSSFGNPGGRGGGQKTVPSVVRVLIFSGITHSDLVPAGRVFMLSEAIHCFATHNFLLE